MQPGVILIALFCLLFSPSFVAKSSPLPPPPPTLEFRGLWVASVGNIDWPSRPGLPVDQQKTELLTILNRAQQMHLNAIILQVRPACDAFYSSTLEPWSEYLTGEMGKAPSPFYDPLSFAVAEAHRRGLELHAWVNPFRARHISAKGAISSTHIRRSHPQLVRTFGDVLWLDPGEPAAQQHSQAVILDIVRRYDIDGLHMDDYFYPYPSKDKREFPDETSWRRYSGSGGHLSRADWRRENINNFVSQLSQKIKLEKPWVRFGISPFGIWRPGFPAGIRGLDSYESLFADSRRWWMSGWVDYLSPQLYWASNDREHSFPALLRWWAEQNVQGRHLWPGLSTYKQPPAEIVNQVHLTRAQPGDDGHILWSARNMLQNKRGLVDSLVAFAYPTAAITPPSPWLSGPAPAKPTLGIAKAGGNIRVNWSGATNELVRFWWVQTHTHGRWQSELISGEQLSSTYRMAPEAVAITAVNRYGKISPVAALEIR